MPPGIVSVESLTDEDRERALRRVRRSRLRDARRGLGPRRILPAWPGTVEAVEGGDLSCGCSSSAIVEDENGVEVCGPCSGLRPTER